MKIKKIALHHQDGSIHFIENEPDILAVIRAIPAKLIWRHTSNLATLRNKYFSMLGELVKQNIGYKKEDLHEAIKPLIFGKFKDFTHYFNDGKYINSTTALTYEGWLAAIEQLQVVANDIFNYTFKP